MKYIIIVIFCLYAMTQTACTVGGLESEYKLGSGYYVLGDPPDNTLSKEVKKHDGVYNDVILGEIVDFDYDNEFIIIYRIATDQARPFFNQQAALCNRRWVKIAFNIG